jgi:hypothetical protein
MVETITSETEKELIGPKSTRTFYAKLNKELDATLEVAKCSNCGLYRIVVFRYEDYRLCGTYGGHTRYFGKVYVAGGKSPENRELCDRCLASANLVDDAKKFKECREEGLSELKEVEVGIKKVLERIKGVVKNG